MLESRPVNWSDCEKLMVHSTLKLNMEKRIEKPRSRRYVKEEDRLQKEKEASEIEPRRSNRDYNVSSMCCSPF